MERQQYLKEYRLRNKAKRNAKARTYYKQNRELMLLKAANFRKRHPDKSKIYYQNNKERFLNYSRNRSKIKRLEVIAHYSNGKNCCNCCGESIYEFLSVDHINGGGRKDRRLHRGRDFYLWLIRESFPKGFQILCHNCNMAKGLYGECPHKNEL